MTTININDLRRIENTYWGTSYEFNLRYPISKIIEQAETFGFSNWPDDLPTIIDKAISALDTISVEKRKRAPLTWEDLTGRNAQKIVDQAVATDYFATIPVTSNVRSEVIKTVQANVWEPIKDTIPAIMTHVAEWIEKHQDNDELAHYVRSNPGLPDELTRKVTPYIEATKLLHLLIEYADPATWNRVEFNYEAHTIYQWTDEQWLAFHAERDTQKHHGNMGDFRTHPLAKELKIKPVRSTKELADRTRHFNDLADEYNKKNRKKELRYS